MRNCWEWSPAICAFAGFPSDSDAFSSRRTTALIGKSCISCATPCHKLHFAFTNSILRNQGAGQLSGYVETHQTGYLEKREGGCNIFEHYVLHTVLYMLYVYSKTLLLCKFRYNVVCDQLLSSSQPPLPNRWREKSFVVEGGGDGGELEAGDRNSRKYYFRKIDIRSLSSSIF